MEIVIIDKNAAIKMAKSQKNNKGIDKQREVVYYETR